MDNIRTIFSIIEEVKNLSNTNSNFKKKKENLYRDEVYNLCCNLFPNITFKKEVQYKDMIDEKSRKKETFTTGITDMEMDFMGRNGVFEFKFNSTHTEKEWNSARCQCLIYGLYKFRSHYIVLDENKIEVIFYNENKHLIIETKKHNRIFLRKFTPRGIAERNTDSFGKLKKHTFKITPSFKIETLLNFINNHYE